jgi:hypothetical protein
MSAEMLFSGSMPCSPEFSSAQLRTNAFVVAAKSSRVPIAYESLIPAHWPSSVMFSKLILLANLELSDAPIQNIGTESIEWCFPLIMVEPIPEPTEWMLLFVIQIQHPPYSIIEVEIPVR